PRCPRGGRRAVGGDGRPPERYPALLRAGVPPRLRLFDRLPCHPGGAAGFPEALPRTSTRPAGAILAGLPAAPRRPVRRGRPYIRLPGAMAGRRGARLWLLHQQREAALAAVAD